MSDCPYTDISHHCPLTPEYISRGINKLIIVNGNMDVDVLQSAVDHSDEKYQCKEMSDCPYTGTNILQKVPWAGQAGADSGSADNKLKRDKTPTLMNKMKNWTRR